jgi:HEAT repeat protein
MWVFRKSLVMAALAGALLVTAPEVSADGGGKQALVAPTKESPSWTVLRKALLSRDYSVRIIVTQGLGDVRGVDVTPWLEHALGDPEHDIRVAAVDALRRIGSPRAVPLLKTVRDDTSEALDVRALAAIALINRTGQ